MRNKTENCEVCGDSDHPEWLGLWLKAMRNEPWDYDPVDYPPIPQCWMTLTGRQRHPKITYLNEADASAAAAAMKEEYPESNPRAYECPWLLACRDEEQETDSPWYGCGRDFPDTWHWHVTSGTH